MLRVSLILCLIGLSAAQPTRYQPLVDNVYHLYTRENPQVSQPLVLGNAGLLQDSNYDNLRRTAVLIHGWNNNVFSDIIAVTAPALLAADDFNLIVVDWSAGAITDNYDEAVANTVAAGAAIGEFINWLNLQTNTNPIQYHIIGHGLGAHVAGFAGRNVNGNIPFITALDPSLRGFDNNANRIRVGDALYVEVIHTNGGANGIEENIGNVDFYPNGGKNMPGCAFNDECSHARSYFYFAESLAGGFDAQVCLSLEDALAQTLCFNLPLYEVKMGGLSPKLIFDGLVFTVTTNASPPFSQT